MKTHGAVKASLLLATLTLLCAAVAFLGGRVAAQADGPDLYIRDTPADTGAEPNPDAGPMWVSNDIWVRRDPDPAYNPRPFALASPSWTPATHQNPVYRSYRKAVPNYVYVRVINRGNAATTGTERLRLNYARASSGLGWPAQWVDSTSSICGGLRATGMEITKPRINAASASATDRARFVQAFLNISVAPFDLPGSSSYWAVQKVIHSATGSGNGDIDVPQHFMETFLPWHRDYTNRIELLMQEADPRVKLLYWDWITNPTALAGLMGSLTGTNAGTPFSSLPNFNRSLTLANLPPPTTTANILAKPWYLGELPGLSAGNPLQGMRQYLENSSHGNAHLTIGADQNGFALAAGDPFFFLIHANADRLFAQWQRQNANRLDPATVYANGAAALNLTTNPEMSGREFKPWNGQGFGSAISPWNSAADPLAVAKTSTDASVVAPPAYDTAPVTVPVLAPGQAVVMQVPWYPPNPQDLACLGGDLRHYCLLARLETASGAPFGMATAEGVDTNVNTRNNNNIAWKNLQIEDEFAAMKMRSTIMLRNIFAGNVETGLRLEDVGRSPFAGQGTLLVRLPAYLQQQWLSRDNRSKGVRFLPRQNAIAVVERTAEIRGLTLPGGALASVELEFTLNKDYDPNQKVLPRVVATQLGAPRDPNRVIGGQAIDLDFRKLRLIAQGGLWRFADGSSALPKESWQSARFDDSNWPEARASLGFGRPVETLLARGANERRTTLYFRKQFDLEDTGFVRALHLRLRRDDGAIVYLNGKEVVRSNLSADAVNAGTPALSAVGAASARTFYTFRLEPGLLRRGPNLLAVEVHRSGPRDDTSVFDLELIANPDTLAAPPEVAFNEPLIGAGWQSDERKRVSLNVADSTGKLKDVALFVDGRRIEPVRAGVLEFELPVLAPGAHTVRAVAQNGAGLNAEVRATIFTAKNVPPSVQIESPENLGMVAQGTAIRFAATASDTAPGRVVRLEFFVRRMERFDDPETSVGSVDGTSGAVEVRDLALGHYMLTVVATDDGGFRSPAALVHVHVM